MGISKSHFHSKILLIINLKLFLDRRRLGDRERPYFYLIFFIFFILRGDERTIRVTVMKDVAESGWNAAEPQYLKTKPRS